MQISVTGRHVEITEAVKDFARDKVSRLSRFFDRIQAIDVVMDHDSGNFSVEIIVHVDRADPFIAQQSGPHALALIDELTDKLGRQLRRHKEKQRDHKHHAGSKVMPLETETD